MVALETNGKSDAVLDKSKLESLCLGYVIGIQAAVDTPSKVNQSYERVGVIAERQESGHVIGTDVQCDGNAQVQDGLVCLIIDKLPFDLERIELALEVPYTKDLGRLRTFLLR